MDAIVEGFAIYEELKDRIKSAMRGINGVSTDPNGLFYCECEMFDRDGLSEAQVADVLDGRARVLTNGETRFEQMTPMGALCRLLADSYQEDMWSIEDYVLEQLKKDEDVAAWMGLHNLDDEGLKECLDDVWYVQPPMDDYLKQDVCMDIMLDTGDANYEFTCNNLASADIDSVEDFDENSSLLWLCEQQGVTRDELLAAFDKGSAHTDEVVSLRARKVEIVSELQEFGFVSPRYTDQVWHTGAYQEYSRLQTQLSKLSKEMQTLSEKRVQNSLSYQDYLKQHFDRFERLDPMTEEQFAERKAEILERLSSKEEAVCTEYARVKDQLDFKTDYRTIALLQLEYKDINRKLKELAQTEEYQKAEFIDSVCEEVHNMSSHMGAVLFLVKMPLENALRLREVVAAEASLNHSYRYEDRTGLGSIVLDKATRVGLFDPCGGGSLMNIALWEDVEIPVKAIGSVELDAARGERSFMSVYGENDEAFELTLKEIKPQSGKIVDNLVADASLRSGGNSPAERNEIGLDI